MGEGVTSTRKWRVLVDDPGASRTHAWDVDAPTEVEAMVAAAALTAAADEVLRLGTAAVVRPGRRRPGKPHDDPWFVLGVAAYAIATPLDG